MWKSGATGSLFKDLARLAILGQYVDDSRAGRQAVFPRAELSDGKLVFVSLPEELAWTGDPEEDLGHVLERAFQGGPIKDFWWDHSRVGRCLNYAPYKPPHMELYLGGNGVHQFRGLRELARRNPRRVRSLLLELFCRQTDQRAA
jgi:hypothetical protein